MSILLLLVLVLLGGWLFSRIFEYIRLPGVIGMLVFGVLTGVIFNRLLPEGYLAAAPLLRTLALVIILLRAGLGLNKQALAKAGVQAILMSFVPCLFEGFALMFMFMQFFAFPMEVAGLTGFMLAAVSPAVIVPSMLELQARGLGARNGVHTIILAGASADDVFAISLFTIFLGLSTHQVADFSNLIVQIPLKLTGGLLLGVLAGLALTWFFRHRYKSIRATEKSLIVLAISLLCVEVGDRTTVAGLLGVMTIGFLLLEKSSVVAHELSQKYAKIWIYAQIILFTGLGLSLDVTTVFDLGLKGVLVILAGLVFRSAGVLLSTAFSPLNMKERWFCVIAYIPKATVQAALGAIALQVGIPQGESILAIAVLAIFLTAPLGLMGIRLTSQRLLGTL